MHMYKLLFAALLLLNIPTGVSQTWIPKASLPDTTNARHHPVTFSIGGYGYLLGGTSTNREPDKGQERKQR